MTLYIPVGVPASGKSTLAADAIVLGRLTERMIVSPDDLREKLTNDRADQSANGVVFDMVEMIATERLRRGLSVWLDATNLTDPKGMLDRLAHIALHRNDDKPSAPHEDYPVITVVMETPIAECYERNAARHHRVPTKIMDRMCERFESGQYPTHGVVVGSRRFGGWLNHERELPDPVTGE